MLSVSILFIFGIFIGSFLNVVSLRYNPGQSLLSPKFIGGRSNCPQCKTTLRWFELVPLISFLIQGRRCRSCDYILAWQYPTIELLTGVITAAIPTYLYSFFLVAYFEMMAGPVFAFYIFAGIWVLAAYVMLVILLIDLRYYIIPDQCSILLGFLGLCIVGLKYFYPQILQNSGSFLGSYAIILAPQNIFASTFLGVSFGIVLFGTIILLTRGRGMGLGDLKMAVPLGLLLGWPDVLIAISVSFIIGSVFGVILMLRGTKKLKDSVPFGPFLVVAVFATMFYGESLMHWYFGLI